jgi:arginyl-tRNA synthetase
MEIPAMTSENPFAQFRNECQLVLADALKKTIPEVRVEPLPLSTPPNLEFGQLSSSLCFELAKKLNQKPADLAARLVKSTNKKKFRLIGNCTVAGGYINFHVNFPKFSSLTVESIIRQGSSYGFVKTKQPLKIIVEHTSVNPLHPIHIGQARNPMLGDAIARILMHRGHAVSRHYYIDDVGRQSSVIAYGYIKLGKPKPDQKSDSYVGKIYTVTSCIVELQRLRKALDIAKTTSSMTR